MKTLMTSLLMILMIGVLAGAALAQDPDDADKTRKLNYENAPGIDGNGGTVRNGDEFVEDGGPHGPVGDGSLDKAMFIDEDGDGFCDLEKTTDNEGKGNNIRNENQYTNENKHGNKGESGPHDPADSVDDEMSKVFGEDCDGSQSQDGDMEQERLTRGPGEAGPHSDSEGFGEACDQDKGDGDSTRSRGAGKR
jgi:hypothetical protein